MILVVVVFLIAVAICLGLSAIGALALQFLLGVFEIHLTFWTSFSIVAAVLALLTLIKGALK